jgi:hypothetical protein
MKNLNIQRVKTLIISFMFAGFAMFSTSCGDGGSAKNIQIPGVIGPKVTLLEDNVLISMVFENINLQGGLRYNIPKYENSYIEISPDLQSNGTLMAVSVSLKDVFNDELNRLDPQALPGGRPLPGVISGRLPAVAFTIEKFKNMSFYIGPKIFGMFVPTKSLNIGGSIVTARFYTGKTRTGNISLVGEDTNGENSGFLLMLDMGSRTTKKLKKVARKFD